LSLRKNLFREISLGAVGEDQYDISFCAARREFFRRRQRRAGGRACEDTFLCRQPLDACESLVVADLDDLIDEAHVHRFRHEVVADALDLVVAVLAAAQRGADGIGQYAFDGRILFFEFREPLKTPFYFG